MNFRLLLVALALAAPLMYAPLAHARTSADSETYRLYSSHDEDDEDEEWGSRRYSSTLSRKIRKLDDDAVENLPMPVLFVDRASLTPDFGDPRGGGTRTHEGQDILAPRGSFIVSPTDAVVVSTGEGSSAGIYVYTVGPGDESFRFMHLDAIAPGVKSGTELKAGDLIGFVGNTGNAASALPHLHFEVREGRKATDPYPRLDGEFTKEELLSSLTSVVKALTKLAKD